MFNGVTLAQELSPTRLGQSTIWGALPLNGQQRVVLSVHGL
jgi:hypothetical protein